MTRKLLITTLEFYYNSRVVIYKHRNLIRLATNDHMNYEDFKTRSFLFCLQVMLMCKATRSGGDHYTFKDSLNLSEYKVQVGTKQV